MKGREGLFGDRVWTLVAGGLAVTLLFAGYYLIGVVQHEGEAQARLEAAIPTIRFFASGVLAASATILALMMTLLGFTQSHDAKFSRGLFQRVRTLSLMNVAAMVGAVFLLMLLTMPVADSEQLQGYYTIAYYVIVGASAAVGGLIIAIAMILHRAVVGLVGLLDPEMDSWLAADSDSPKSE